MIEAVHGVRPTYQKGCSCRPCRAAEAAYRSHLRWQHRTGRLILGSTCPAGPVHRLLRSLAIEHVTQALIARRLGLKRGLLDWHPERVRVRTYLKIKLVAREILGPDETKSVRVLGYQADAVAADHAPALRASSRRRGDAR